MKLLLMQPPYPEIAGKEGARSCIEWMIRELNACAPGKADLIVLPEYATSPSLDDAGDMKEMARTEGARLLRACRDTARRCRCSVVVGTIHVHGEEIRNRVCVIDASGEDAGFYDKIHLPTAEESMGLAPGGAPTLTDIDGLRLGIATCFDVYFPEHFGMLAAAGADLILSPSYQRSETEERLRLISACRALDGAAWFARASYAMPDGDRGGHSLVAAPWGHIVADAGTAPGTLLVEFDPRQRFVKPASFGQGEIEHGALLAARRRPRLYRPYRDREQRILASPFPRLCAHRGLSHACPENTLPAFAAAVALDSVQEIELDLWLSRDGVPVVCHDPRVDRTCNGVGTVTEMDWEDIRRLDAGLRHGEAWAGIRLPRFEEVVEVTDGRVGLNIHIKNPGANGELVALVARVLRERGMDRIGYIAGDEDVLDAARRLAPDIDRCCLAHQDDNARLISTAVAYGCRRLQFFRGVTTEAAAEAAAQGLIRNLFWSDEADEARNFAALGIDVILTNRAHQLSTIV